MLADVAAHDRLHLGEVAGRGRSLVPGEQQAQQLGDPFAGGVELRPAEAAPLLADGPHHVGDDAAEAGGQVEAGHREGRTAQPAVHLAGRDGHDQRAGRARLDDPERRRGRDEAAGARTQPRLAAVLHHEHLAVQREQEPVAAVAARLPRGADVVRLVRQVQHEPVLGAARPGRPAEHVVHRRLLRPPPP